MPLVDRQTPRPETGETSTGMPVESDKPTLGTPGVTTRPAPDAPKNAARDAVRGAVESTVPEQSRAEWTTSYDVADFGMPTGREEVWRFTPMKRVKSLLELEQTSDVLDWTTELPAGVTLEPISPERARELAVEAPLDRVSALAAARASSAAHLDVPAPGGGPRLAVVGIGSEWAGHSRPAEALRGLSPASARLVLMHNPESFKALPAETAPLALAGHTHGGQVRIPGFPRWSWLHIVRSGEVTADGWIDPSYGAAGNRLYVNRGIGFSTIPVRINCRPELTTFTLRRASGKAGVSSRTATL